MKRFSRRAMLITFVIGFIAGTIVGWPRGKLLDREQAFVIADELARAQCLDPPEPPTSPPRDRRDCEHIERTGNSETDEGWWIDYRIVKRRLEFSFLVTRLGRTDSASYMDYNDFPAGSSTLPSWERPPQPPSEPCEAPGQCPDLDRAIANLPPGPEEATGLTGWQQDLYRRTHPRPTTLPVQGESAHSAASR